MKERAQWAGIVLFAALAAGTGCGPQQPRASGPNGASATRTASITPRSGAFRQVPFGLCEDYPEESRSIAEVRRDLGVLKEAGIDVLRVSIGWDGVEPERDRYDFAFWDTFVDLAVREYGIRLIPYVAYTPRWDSDGTPEDFWRTPPRDLREFTEIMRLLAERYRGRITSWEIWNEPDNREYWLGTPADYGALLAAGSEGVRAGDPGAQVVFGGLAGGVEFLRALFDQYQASARVDVVNLHSYYETWNENPLETISEYLGEVSAIVEHHGRHQPLWMAEVGYSNFKGEPGKTLAGFEYEHSLDFQAVVLMRTMALALASPAVSLIAWYELKDPRASDAVIGDAHNRHLGVLFADYRRKPAFDALVFTNTLFRSGFRAIDAELRWSAPGSDDVELHGFRTARSTVLVIAWLKTHGTRAPTAGVDTRREHVRVSLPYAARAQPKLYDERGRVRPEPVAVRSDARSTELDLDLRGGEVRVLELPVGG